MAAAAAAAEDAAAAAATEDDEEDDEVAFAELDRPSLTVGSEGLLFVELDDDDDDAAVVDAPAPAADATMPFSLLCVCDRVCDPPPLLRLLFFRP